MFVAPPEKEVEWTDSGLEGSYRFLARVWRLVDGVMPMVRDAPPVDGLAFDVGERALRRRTHVTIRRVTGDVDPRVHLNTAISALMELVNELYAFADARNLRAGPGAAGSEAIAGRPAAAGSEAIAGRPAAAGSEAIAGRPAAAGSEAIAGRPAAAASVGVAERQETAAAVREAVEALVLMLSPFAPHMCEELWERLGHAGGVVAAGWPAADEGAMREESVEIPVQVNGKLRGRVTVAAEADEADIEAAARSAPGVVPHLEGRQVVKVIIARGRLVNIVVK